MGAATVHRRLAVAILVAVPALSLGGLAWLAWRSPDSRFLPPDGPAGWIAYPVPPSAAAVLDGPEQHAVFRQTFEVSAVPASARLLVRARNGYSVHLNGRPVELPGCGDGNRAGTADVADHLQAGTNEIRVVVANGSGPPVLWLSLAGPDWSVVTDGRWRASLDGATECPAQPAGRPPALRAGNPAAGGDRPLDSLRARLPTFLLFALLSGGVLLSAYVLARCRASGRLFASGPSPLAVGVLAAALLWVLLLGHNLLCMPLHPAGFDSDAHLKYIAYIQQHNSIPLADQGWEMYQPPLYYLLAAGLLAAWGLPAQVPEALVTLRLLGLAAGLAQLVLVAGCLRLLFPAQPRRQLGGLALAAFAPAPIYLCHYVTNDALLMTLGTASVYLCLRVLREERPSAGWHALLGLCLGAALLTKLSAVVVAGVVLLVLAGRLVARRERAPGAWLRSLGVTLAVTLVTSGWHYARVWAHFGTPLAGNFGSLAAFRWWQEPGHCTLAYLGHFGRSLQEPFYSALYSLPDGLYSTYWGDGLCGGLSGWAGRPPWNYDLMAAGYLLALGPSLAIVVGLGATLVELVRRPRAEWFLVLGLGGGLAVAMVYQLLSHPYACVANARHVLIGAVVPCALGAWGLDCLARLGRVPAALLVVLVGTWACTAYLSFWIDPNGAVTHNWDGLEQRRANHAAKAEDSFREAIRVDPHGVPARFNEALMLLPDDRRREEARRLLEEVRRDHPEDADVLLGLALLWRADGQPGAAAEGLRRASEVAPDSPWVYSVLGDVLLEQNQDEAAIAAYREAVRVVPSSPSDHANLGLLLARRGRTGEALAQYRRALALRPDHPALLADMAWILAAEGAAECYDPAEALRLAEEACRRTGGDDAACLQSLAAAQAAMGRYPDAERTAERARRVAAATRQDALLPGIDRQRESYQRGKPLAASAPARSMPYASVPPLGLAEWEEAIRKGRRAEWEEEIRRASHQQDGQSGPGHLLVVADGVPERAQAEITRRFQFAERGRRKSFHSHRQRANLNCWKRNCIPARPSAGKDQVASADSRRPYPDPLSCRASCACSGAAAPAEAACLLTWSGRIGQARRDRRLPRPHAGNGGPGAGPGERKSLHPCLRPANLTRWGDPGPEGPRLGRIGSSAPTRGVHALILPGSRDGCRGAGDWSCPACAGVRKVRIPSGFILVVLASSPEHRLLGGGR